MLTCENGGSCEVHMSGGGVFGGTEVGECVCVDGFSGDSCEVAPVDACSPNPCLHGGECEHVTFPMPHTACRCVDGYSGQTCPY